MSVVHFEKQDASRAQFGPADAEQMERKRKAETELEEAKKAIRSRYRDIWANGGTPGNPQLYQVVATFTVDGERGEPEFGPLFSDKHEAKEYVKYCFDYQGLYVKYEIVERAVDSVPEMPGNFADRVARGDGSRLKEVEADEKGPYMHV